MARKLLKLVNVRIATGRLVKHFLEHALESMEHLMLGHLEVGSQLTPCTYVLLKSGVLLHPWISSSTRRILMVVLDGVVWVNNWLVLHNLFLKENK
jgi:hypothetical protein